MPFEALATDYDGTLAESGQTSRQTLLALCSLKAMGQKLILVTGRELKDLQRVFPDWSLFDIVVAENGATIYSQKTGREKLLAAAPPQALVDELQRLGVNPLSIGRCIVATVDRHEHTIQAAIGRLQLSWHIVRNRETVMALQKGITKATGFSAALAELDLAEENVVGIGDAENDEAFLIRCGYSVAVANATPGLKERVNYVAQGSSGAGVIEAVHLLLSHVG